MYKKNIIIGLTIISTTVIASDKSPKDRSKMSQSQYLVPPAGTRRKTQTPTTSPLPSPHLSPRVLAAADNRSATFSPALSEFAEMHSSTNNLDEDGTFSVSLSPKAPKVAPMGSTHVQKAPPMQHLSPQPASPTSFNRELIEFQTEERLTKIDERLLQLNETMQKILKAQQETHTAIQTVLPQILALQNIGNHSLLSLLRLHQQQSEIPSMHSPNDATPASSTPVTPQFQPSSASQPSFAQPRVRITTYPLAVAKKTHTSTTHQ